MRKKTKISLVAMLSVHFHVSFYVLSNNNFKNIGEVSKYMSNIHGKGGHAIRKKSQQQDK
jgi:hypothetical protein